MVNLENQKVLIAIVEKALVGKSLPKDKKGVLDEIRKKTKDRANYSYAMHWYMEEILRDNETDPGKARTFFTGLFIYFLEDVFPADAARVAPTYALAIEGLRDIYNIEVQRKLIINQPGGVRLAETHLFKNLYIRSKYEDTPIMIEGETGTSKSFMARAIHNISERRHGPFLSINCAAIPEHVLESELFGHKKGAFTGAVEDKEGLLSMGKRGIIFLDEVGKMDQRLQYKILKAIEEKEFRPVGGAETKKFDARFIAAVQPTDIKEDKIIPDLLFRLGHPDNIKMPTLNERMFPDPVIPITSSLLRVMHSMGKDFKLSKEAINTLAAHKYEGNYRELENVLRRAARSALIANRSKILPCDFELSDNTLSEQIKATPPFSGMLKDVFDYTDKLAHEVVKAKVEEVFKNGGDIKKDLMTEGGLSESQYQTFTRQVNRVLSKKGMNITKIKEQFRQKPPLKSDTI